MTNEQILEFNKLCADFLGATINTTTSKDFHFYENLKMINNQICAVKTIEDEWLDVNTLKFHSDWKLLMSVKQKISELGYLFFVFPDSICVNKNRTISSPKITRVEFKKPEDEKNALVEATYNFLIWYNDKQKTK